MSKKKKRQKFLNKILKDNKVSKKEVRKAQKKGIKLDRITKAARKSTQPGNVFSQQRSSPRTNPADYFKRGGGQPSGPPGLYPRPTAPAPKAPVIRPGAQTLIDRDNLARAAAAFQPQTGGQNTGSQNTGTGGGDNTGGGDVGNTDDQFDTSYFDDLIASQDDVISDLNMRIGDLTSGFEAQLGQMNANMEAERQRSADAMAEMQGSFAQALSQRKNRKQVQGIRFADRGTGGATQAQLRRRGLRGSFGRRGERLMKISALNV